MTVLAIVITGNPGVGKHTVSEKLAKELGYMIVDINMIAIQSNAAEKSSEAYEVDTDKLKDTIKDILRKEHIVVGHLAPHVLTRDQVDKTIVLRRSPYELIKVYIDRGYSQEKSRENIESEILGVVASDAQENLGELVQVDVTGKTTKEVTRQIRSILSGEKKGDSVDWLSLVAKNDDLRKFFSY